MAVKNWFDLWYEDKRAILATMYKNLVSDLGAGYNPLGSSITKQKNEIAEYEKEFDESMKKFRTMTEQQIQHYCFYDMKRRGAIE